MRVMTLAGVSVSGRHACIPKWGVQCAVLTHSAVVGVT